MDASIARTSNSRSRNNSLFHLLHRTEQFARSLFKEALGESDLTLPQHVILDVLMRNGAMKQSELSRLTGIDRSTITEIIKRMVANGSVERDRNRKDARAYSVNISSIGRLHHEQTSRAVGIAEQRFLERIPPASRQSFQDALASVARMDHATALVD